MDPSFRFLEEAYAKILPTHYASERSSQVPIAAVPFPPLLLESFIVWVQCTRFPFPRGNYC